MELEIKFAPVLPQQAETVLAHGDIAPYTSPAEVIKMKTAYYDTPDSALRNGKYTLRMRRENDRSICTLKGRNTSEGRLEIAHEAETLAQGLDLLLGDGELPQDAAQLLRQGGFTKVCGASFVRKQVEYSREGLRCFIAHDNGQVENGSAFGAICELEVELIEGSREAFDALCVSIKNSHGFEISTLSKHKRALQLTEHETGKEVNPFFVGSELLNYCVKKGYIDFGVGEDKRLHYYLGKGGADTLYNEFGVDFSKSCAFLSDGAADEE